MSTDDISLFLLLLLRIACSLAACVLRLVKFQRWTDTLVGTLSPATRNPEETPSGFGSRISTNQPTTWDQSQTAAPTSTNAFFFLMGSLSESPWATFWSVQRLLFYTVQQPSGVRRRDHARWVVDGAELHSALPETALVALLAVSWELAAAATRRLQALGGSSTNGLSVRWLRLAACCISISD